MSYSESSSRRQSLPRQQGQSSKRPQESVSREEERMRKDILQKELSRVEELRERLLQEEREQGQLEEERQAEEQPEPRGRKRKASTGAYELPSFEHGPVCSKRIFDNSYLHQDPPQPLPTRDYEFEKAFNDLQADLSNFVIKHFQYDMTPADQDLFRLDRVFEGRPLLRHYVAFSAIGDPNWDQYFLNKEKRPSIAAAVISKILEDYVFKRELFGADKGQQELLVNLDLMLRDTNSFKRETLRAHMIGTFMSTSKCVEGKRADHTSRSFQYDYPRLWTRELEYLTGQTYRLLVPLLPTPPDAHRGRVSRYVDLLKSRMFFKHARRRVPEQHEEAVADLREFLQQAARLATAIRLRPNVIFNVKSAGKDEAFDDETMTCINRKYMAQQFEDHFDEIPRVSVSVFPEVSVYKPGDGNDCTGLTYRRICKASVVLDYASGRVAETLADAVEMLERPRKRRKRAIVAATSALAPALYYGYPRLRDAMQHVDFAIVEAVLSKWRHWFEREFTGTVWDMLSRRAVETPALDNGI